MPSQLQAALRRPLETDDCVGMVLRTARLKFVQPHNELTRLAHRFRNGALGSLDIVNAGPQSATALLNLLISRPSVSGSG